ncbi:MAG: ribose-phosphate diphosphokinase [Actinomycetota bacterium]|jgi:ribose-phosphate pyrophosphokinase|nr:ribose-phosphate diphosphokinase [Actinomycetota bacterium]MDQ3772612.1 ribose-phosphate diphosphokinase [Actinomycetota bacterium]
MPTHKRLMIFSGTANVALAEEVTECLGMKLGVAELSVFANSETYVRFAESVRGIDAFVIQSMSDPVDHNVMQQMIMIDALKRGSAKRITAVCPFYPYSRQDRKARGREPITAKLMADFYEAAGADRVMAVDLHTGQIQGFFDVPFDHLTALPMLADHFSEMVDDNEVMIISPDAGGGGWADKWSDHLAEFHGMASQVGFLHKKRRKDARNVSETLAVVGDVKNKTCIVVDDMIDTGGTLTSGVEALLASGAKEVYAAATHAVLSGPAVDRIKNSQLQQLVVTNTLPISDDKTMDKLAVLSIAPTIANTIKAVFEEGSVSELFHGENQP